MRWGFAWDIVAYGQCPMKSKSDGSRFEGDRKTFFFIIKTKLKTHLFHIQLC